MDPAALESTVPPTIVRIGAAALLLAGLLGVWTQGMSLWRPSLLGEAFYAAGAAAGALAMLVAWFYASGRVWAAFVGLLMALVLTGTSLSHFVAEAMEGRFFFVNVLAATLAPIALALLPWGVKPCLRVAKARRAIRDEL